MNLYFLNWNRLFCSDSERQLDPMLQSSNNAYEAGEFLRFLQAVFILTPLCSNNKSHACIMPYGVVIRLAYYQHAEIIILQPAGGCLLAMGSMIYKEISRCNNTL